MKAPPIHEILPGCLMLPPLHFPVWTADGTQEVAVWTGKWWASGPIEPIWWQEMVLRWLEPKAEGSAV
jgi:hypothetical protein